MAQVAGWLHDDQRLCVVTAFQERIHAYGNAQWLDAVARGWSDPTRWYLSGVVVDPDSRRHGLGEQLVSARLEALSKVTNTVWYVVNARNDASIALHSGRGFEEVRRGDRITGVEFTGGEGFLYRVIM